MDSLPGVDTAPVVLLVFNRPHHTRKLLEQVRLARPPVLLVIADGPRPGMAGEQEACAEVRSLFEEMVDWGPKVLRQYARENLGLRRRVSSGLGWAFEQVDRAIVLEDDCVPHPGFFRFCSELLECYAQDTRVGVITGDNFQAPGFKCPYSYYFSKFPHCWGWASWRRAWRHFDEKMSLWPELKASGWLRGLFPEAGQARYWEEKLDGVYERRINSWAFCWTFACWSQGLLTATPKVNLVSNIGFGSDSTHCQDPASPMANLTTQAMEFPLRHPPGVVLDYRADEYTQRTVFGSAAPPPSSSGPEPAEVESRPAAKAGGLSVARAEELESKMEQYFQERLESYRHASIPWVLHPGAWLARMNRNRLRKLNQHRPQATLGHWRQGQAMSANGAASTWPSGPETGVSPAVRGKEKVYSYEGGCDAVWRGCLIRSNGDVFPCCFSWRWESMRLGNLHHADFEQIWHSPRAQQLREYSRHGRMPCPQCLVPHWRKIPAQEGPRAASGSLRTPLADLALMQLEPSPFCNGRCYMCALDVTDKREVDYGRLRRALEKLHLRNLNLVGGEAFFAPTIEPFLAWLYGRVQTGLLTLSMTSNGALPKRRIEEIVRSFVGFDVTFLGTTPDIEQAVSGLNFGAKIEFLKALVQARNAFDFQDRPRLRLGINFTVVPTNFHQIPQIIELAEELGVDYLNYNYDGFVHQLMAAFPKLAQQVSSRLERTLQKSRNLEVNTAPLVSLQLIPASAQVSRADKRNPAAPFTAGETSVTEDADPRRAIPPVLASELAEAAGLLQRSKPAEAMASLDIVKTGRKPIRNTDYLRALCFLQQQRPGDAAEALKEELRWFPEHEEAGALLKEIRATLPAPVLPDDAEFRQLYALVQDYTMLGVERLYSLYKLADQVCRRDLPGDFVECGVAAGGASALMAAVISRHSRRPRRMYACDSFEGMPDPREVDLHMQGQSATALGWGAGTCAAPVESLMEVCGKLQVQGLVEPVKGLFAETLPLLRRRVPAIALLHVDGDWYDSTRTVFDNLYPLVVERGCIQVDDYAYWQGCRRAVEDFQQQAGLKFNLHPVEGIAAWMEKTHPVCGSPS